MSPRIQRLLLSTLVLLAAAPLGAQHEGHGAPARQGTRSPALGRVVFPNSGAAAAQAPFLRGVALLHSFEYEDAAEALREAQKADPALGVAYWAEALTYSPIIWGFEDLAAARAALGRLGPTAEARLATARTPRERAFGAAVEALYAPAAQPVRVRGFADSVRRWVAAFPDDHEAHAFAALGTIWQGFLVRGEAGAALIAEAAAHAQRVFDANPQHPGAAHYLIHAWDAPATAEKGLAAARAYARIAPDAEHALHMPSHIFLPLGMWDDMVASNERAWAASRAWATRRGKPAWANDWHSLNWLQYAYLQQGRWKEARALVDTARRLTAGVARPAPASVMPDAVLAAEQLAFRYGAETGRWDAWTGDAEAIDWRDTTITLRARSMALSSAYQRAAAAILARRDTMPAHATAHAFREAMAARRAGTPMMSGLTAMLDAMLQQQRGDLEGAIGTLRSLREAARAARFSSMTPSSTLHVHEELGAALLATGRAKEAVAVYEEALRDQPDRAAALLGLARAQAAAGDTTGVRATQARLAATWKRADAAVRSTTAIDARR